MMRVFGSPWLMLVLAIVCWSGNWLLGRGMRAETTPVSLAFLRWVVAAGVLLPFFGAALWRKRRLALTNWRILGLLGISGAGLYHLLLYLALANTTAINASYFYTATPVVILLMSWLIDREPISLRQGLGIIISLLGVLSIITEGRLELLAQFQFHRGDLYALANVPLWALYNVLLRRRPADITPMELLTLCSLIAVVVLLPFYLWENLVAGGGMALTVPTVVTVLYVGIFASVAALTFWNRGVMAIGAARAGLFSHLLPVFITVTAIIFLDERLFPHHLAGISLIFIGIFLATSTRALRLKG